MKAKAVFLDRDGIIIKMHYHRNLGLIDTPLTVSHVEFVPGIFDFLKLIKKLGYLSILISNQPAIGIKKVSKKNFVAIKDYITDTLKKKGVPLDDQYYCLHHPFASIAKYKKKCECRKPSPNLLFKAAKKHNIDLTKSWMIGDGIHDIRAGYNAGCKTILIANLMESEYLRIISEQLMEIKPDYLTKNLKHAITIFKNFLKQ